MQSQVTTLTEENKRLHDESEVSDSLVLTLQEEVKMLAKERDEARRINNDTLESSVREVVKLRDGVEKDIERLSLELAELRSAPGIDEVDEILRDVNSSMFDNQERLASITRRAIASREEEKQRADEVAGLLKWWVSFKGGFVGFGKNNSTSTSASVTYRDLGSDIMLAGFSSGARFALDKWNVLLGPDVSAEYLKVDFQFLTRGASIENKSFFLGYGLSLSWRIGKWTIDQSLMLQLDQAGRSQWKLGASYFL
jgi:hypothetical protein